jgi:hypothetical protein
MGSCHPMLYRSWRFHTIINSKISFRTVLQFSPEYSLFYALFVWLIRHQSAVFFSHNKSANSNQPAVLFSQNKPAPAKRTGTDESYMLLHTFEEFPRDSAKEFSNFTCLLLVY